MDHEKIRKAKEIVGNTFALTVLLQKRCRELVQGAAPLVDSDSDRWPDIALEEVLQGKIWLSDEVRETKTDEGRLLLSDEDEDFKLVLGETDVEEEVEEDEEVEEAEGEAEVTETLEDDTIDEDAEEEAEEEGEEEAGVAEIEEVDDEEL